jgi:starch-binding outer membrane protein SusE/F
MKPIFKLFSFIAIIALLFSACSKVEDLPIYTNGTAPVITSSVLSTAPSATDSNKVAITLSWTNPKYASDSATNKYVIEIDSTGRNFSKSKSKTVVGSLSTTYTAKELNNILLEYGFNYNTPYEMDVRVKSSYANNNQVFTSNVLKIKMAAYVTPPKVALPTSGKLFLVGDASQGGWNNPVPTPTQEFVKIDSVTFGGIFNLNASKEYLVLPVNGDWSHKFAVNNKSLTGLSAGGDFGYDLGDNFPGPGTAGWYKIVLNFQTGKFTVTPYTGVLPTNLFIVGDATSGGWNNPVPAATQQFTRVNSSVFELTLPLNAGKEYLLLPVNGDWSHKYAVADKTVVGLSAGGNFGYDLGDNFPAPTVSGNYKIAVNFVTGKFSTTKQ